MLDKWSHVAGTYDKSTGTRRIYVNGNLVGERIDPTVTITQGIADLTTGVWSTPPGYAQQYFPGRIDEVSIYNRALSQAELQAIYTAGDSGKCVGKNAASVESIVTSRRALG